MIEDLPHPLVPQRATTLFLLLSTVSDTPFKTSTSGLLGYLKITSRSSTQPLLVELSSLIPPVELILGFYFISYTILSDAPSIFIAFPNTAASMPKFIKSMIM